RLVHDVLFAPDPRQRLALWLNQAGAAGRAAQAFNGFPTPDTLLEQARLLDQALALNPLPEPLIAHRGLDHIGFMAGHDPDDLQTLVGTTQTEPGYLSTSLGANAHLPNWNHRMPIELHLALPTGTHGLWPGRHSRVPAQRELILPRGTRYRIKRAAINSEGILHLHADVLP
ncbi:ADP-ribosyltransferase, partial [Nocardiopsis sp. LOL_012]|uniref:ADP-ribosyltransferase n=1 Tax=Nocardiopsis sp. LOL_012 TaxID=3345409 RepID=UPI003A84B2C7